MAKLRDIALWAASRLRPSPAGDARLVRTGPHARPVETILILKLDRIGDFVIGLDACRRLRNRWPAARITCVCAGWNVDLARRAGLFDEVVAYDFFTRTIAKHRQPMADRIERFRALKLGPQDIAIDLRHDDDTRILLGEVDAGLRAGFETNRGGVALDLVLPRFDAAARRHGATELAAGDRLSLLADAVILAMAAGEGGARPVRAPRRGLIVMTPGAGFAVKRWPTERWVELCLQLGSAPEARLVFVGGPEDRAFNAIVAERIRAGGGAVDDRTADLPMADVLALIDEAERFIGLDSGLSHIAAERGVPTVTLFSGHADPAVWMPRGPRAFGIHAELSCSPCGLKDIRYCRADHACMRSIEVADVLDLARQAVADAD